MEGQESSSIQPLLAGLQRLHGRLKPVKEAVERRHRKTRGSMGIDMAVDARTAPHVNQIILFSGNGDFRPLIKAAAPGHSRKRLLQRLHAPAYDRG